MELMKTDEKLEYLNRIEKSPPDFAFFRETSIPKDGIDVASTGLNPMPFNYPNPSSVDAARVHVIEQQGLDVSRELTMEPKMKTFQAVVMATRKALNSI